MKDTDLNKQVEDIDEKMGSLRKSISKLNSTPLKDEIVTNLSKLEMSMGSAKGIISDMLTPFSLSKYILIVFISMIVGFSIAALIFQPYSLMDVPVDYNSEDSINVGLQIGDIAGTTPDYTSHFNESFLGYVTDVNKTNRTETALITVKNGETEIVLNEYWLQCVSEEWFEYNYNVDFGIYPVHYTDFNGTYQLVDDFYYPYSNDWDIIHTQDGKLKLEYYSPDDKLKLYYYNKTYPGGAEVEYVNEKFIIIYNQEEIKHERML